jgi:aminoglycoside 6'-N-acetyltransferase
MIQGEKVNLRPLTKHDLALFEAWANDADFHSEFNSFGLRSPNYIEKGFAEDGLISPKRGSLLIVNKNGEVLGDISYHQVSYGPNEGSRGYNIGLSLIPAQRGKGYGVEAQRLLAAYLFATYNISRVEATTDITNLPEQRALEKAGFSREGVLRQAQWRNGAWHDMVQYSKLRHE